MRSTLILAACLLATSCNLIAGDNPSAPPAGTKRPAAPTGPPSTEPLKLKHTSGDALTVWAVPPAKSALEALAADFRKLHKGGWNLSYLDRKALLDALKTEGAAPQVLIFADAETAEALRSAGAIDVNTLRSFAGDTLVIVSRADANWATASVFDLYELRFTHLAIGDRAATSAGYYAYQSLVSDGAWDRIKERIIELPSQDELLQSLLVVKNHAVQERERGAAQIAVLLGSSAATTKGVKAFYAVPEDLHEPVRYQVAAAAGHANDPGVSTLLRLLAEDPDAQAKLASYGYLDRAAALKIETPR